MSETILPDATPVHIADTTQERTFDHYVCCSIPTGEIAMTRAFCGEMVLFEGRDLYGGDVCPVCVELSQHDICPLGKDCEVIR